MLLSKSLSDNNFSNVKLLLGAKADVNSRAFLWNILEKGDIKMMQLLLEYGADPYKRFNSRNLKQHDTFMYFHHYYSIVKSSNNKQTPVSKHMFDMMLKHAEKKENVKEWFDFINT